MAPKKRASVPRKRGSNDVIAGPSNAKRQRTNAEESPRNSPALEDEKELEISALESQAEQLRSEKQDLESTRETDQQRLGEFEREIADLKDENDRLTKENAELKEKQERVEALGGINELEEDQKRLEELRGLDQIEEEQERIENLGGLDQLEEEHELIQKFDNFETAQMLNEKIDKIGGIEAFEGTVTWLEEIFGNLDEAQRFMEKINEFEDMDILEQEHDWVQSLGGLQTASNAYEHAIDNHDAMVEQVENQHQYVEDMERRTANQLIELQRLERLKLSELQQLQQLRRERCQERPNLNSTILPSTNAYALAILEAAKQSIKKQMTKSRACNPTEPWFHWGFCPTEDVFRHLFGTNAKRHQINWWELDQMLGGDIRFSAIARGYVHLCGQVDIVWKPEEMTFKMSGFCE
ncbi:hypothetical protein KCU67_g12814, partial [Aureobasidium melanogenum]